MSSTRTRTLMTGMLGGVLSAGALMLCGRAEGTTAAGPLNGPSQWLWGERAAYSRRWSHRTLAGIGIHHLSALGWAVMHVMVVSRRPTHDTTARRVARAAGTAALAAAVDYGVAPRRLQPGFDKQLSLTSLVVVYVAFATGLALADALYAPAMDRTRHRQP